MARSPRFKIHSVEHGYIGSVKHLEDAALLVSVQGDGATVRDNGHANHDIIFTQGADGNAGESYDDAAVLMIERIDAKRRLIAVPIPWPARGVHSQDDIRRGFSNHALRELLSRRYIVN